MNDPAAIVEALGMQRHPEGGWYGETWRAPAAAGARSASSAILYLLAAGESSHWHRVDADEICQFSAGDPLALRVARTTGGHVERHVLGGDPLRGEAPQVVVPAGAWQAANPLGSSALVGCIVAPAFQFDGFELAPDGWHPEIDAHQET